MQRISTNKGQNLGGAMHLKLNADSSCVEMDSPDPCSSKLTLRRQREARESGPWQGGGAGSKTGEPSWAELLRQSNWAWGKRHALETNLSCMDCC